MARSPVLPRLRNIRYGRFNRVRRARRFVSWLALQQTDLNGTGAGATFTGAAGTTVTWTAHAKLVGDGPFVLTTTGTLPGGLALSTPYWVVGVVNVNAINISTQRNGPAVVMTSAGSGVHTITKASSRRAIYDYVSVKGRHPAVVGSATDVDNL